MARAGIALGSNVGDRLALLRAARERLGALHAGVPSDFLVSPVFETAPVDCPPGASAFLNAAVELETALEPLDLLDAAQAIERGLGRPDRRPRNAPRTIDVDLLYLEDRAWDDPRLILPHPRLAERRFVLAPLAAIRPGLRLPGTSGTIAAMLARLEAGEEPAPTVAACQW